MYHWLKLMSLEQAIYHPMGPHLSAQVQLVLVLF